MYMFMKPEEKKNNVDYGLLGSGSQVLLRGSGMIGTIAVSGLRHIENHNLISNTLKQYFEEQTE